MKWDWEKINFDLVKEAGDWAVEAFQKGYYFENLDIHFLILEGTLRIALAKFLVEKEKWGEEKALRFIENLKYFGELVQKFHEYAKDEEIFKKLDEIREERNKLIHGLFLKYKNFEEAKEVAKQLGPKIETIKEELKEKYF